MELSLATVDPVVDKEAEVALSVIIVVRDAERAAPIPQLFRDYKHQVEQTGLQYEFIFVIEGDYPALLDDLRRLIEQEERIKVLVFAKWYGDATVLAAGFEHASGAILLTLPAYHQIDLQAIPSLITALEGNDMVVVRRWPRADGTLNQMQIRVFHGILKRVMGFDFHDLGCSVRIFRREVCDKVYIYGDQHRFFPVLASHYGFKVIEVKVPQAKEDGFQRRFSPGVYIHRFLDLLSIFFLAKFTKKPLRFFGFTGVLTFASGAVITLLLAFQRIFMDVALADKPILLLGVLLIVLGTLLFAIGLIGELIIFTHAKDLKEYRIEKVIN